ncbi:MAG: PD40 domain-containing protein [Bacteroidales bacterium]|nr:PD40 domain-containing protein [Bacteroidales bacterium]
MKRIFAILALSGLFFCAFAQEHPLWLRQHSLSPDGNTIAFAWQGDIYTVPAAGGQAFHLTTNPAHDADPLWTPDGQNIVFSSVREGTKDIWLVPAQGGRPRRLTTYNGSETPLTVGPDGLVYFLSDIQIDPAYSGFPNTQQLYSVPVAGGKVKSVSALPVSSLSIGADGSWLYEDQKGYEDPLRKHHTSSVTRDVWRRSPDGSFARLTDFTGEDRNPVFSPDGADFYYLSEQGGNFNVWVRPVSGGPARQVTNLPIHPVRYLNVARSGRISFSWNGELYTLEMGAAPVKVEITLLRDRNEKEEIVRSASGVQDIAVSPNGKEIAIVSRGNIYVTSVEYNATRRITETPEQERGVSFSKDGRTLYYASERDGEWGIWKSELSEKDDKLFCISYKVKEERFTEPGQTCFQPEVSPDGKWVAFLRDRTELVVKPTGGGKEKSLLKGTNYSYHDGDQSFAWSPDSRYLLCNYQADGGWNHEDVALIEVASGKVTNLTQSGYSDGAFRWALGGKAMTWESDKAGYRSHGSWGAEGDIYIMFFDDAALTKFNREKDVEDIEKLRKDSDKKPSAKKKEEGEAKDSTAREEKKPEKFDHVVEGREDRIQRLTLHSARLGDHFLSPDGTKLFYTAQLEKSRDLCCLDLRKKSVRVVARGVSGAFYPSPDGKSFYVVRTLGISKYDANSGTAKSVSWRDNFEYDPAKERAYIFSHVWKQVAEKFYDPAIHGLDWAALRDNYARFLPHINDNYAFSELLSELLGELNASHTGCRFYDMSLRLFAPNVGRLGVFFDDAYDGKGLRIREVLPGGTLARACPGIAAGDLILALDGEEIEAGKPWYEVFARKGGKRVLLSLKKGGKKEDVYVTPVSSDRELLYKRWVRHNEQEVERLSGGRVGYVHVQGMNSESFREVYSKALGKYRGCEALIVDTRHNGGGWLHDDLATLLGGKAYLEFRPRGQYISTEPYSKWTKPSCVLMGEDNYSDACGFPFTYRALGIGKLIGAPVPGTMTAVWWERQIDPTLVFGIPQVGSWSLQDGCYLENYQIEPDIAVYNDPASVLRGEDKQLEAAVAEMLKQTATKE